MNLNRLVRSPVFWILLGLICLASSLRVANATWGIPELHPYRDRFMESLYPDEFNVVGPMQSIWAGDLLQVGSLTYLPVQALLGVAVVWLTGWDSTAGFYQAARSVSMLASIGSVVLLFLLGRRWNTRTALIAAGFLTFSMGAVREAHWANAESLSAFWSLLAVLLAFKAADSKRSLLFFLLGVCVGLSFCSKYLGVLFLHLPLVAFLVPGRLPGKGNAHQRSGFLDRGRIPQLLVSFLGFAVVSLLFLGPYLVGNLELVMDTYQTKLAPWASSHGLYGTFPGPVSPPRYVTEVFPAALGVPLYACALAGAALCVLRRSRPYLVLMAAGLPFFLFLELARYHQIRFSTSLLPILCLLAAGFLDTVLSTPERWIRSASWLLLAAVLGYSAFYSYAFIRVLDVRADARYQVDDWLAGQLPTAADAFVLGYDQATNSLGFIQYDGMDRLAGPPGMPSGARPRFLALPTASSDILFQFLELREKGYVYTARDWWPISPPSEETARVLADLRDGAGYRVVKVFRNEAKLGWIRFAKRLPFDTFRTTNLEVEIFEREPAG